MLDENVVAKDGIRKCHPKHREGFSVVQFSFLILALIVFTSCTDYVQQINDQKEDFLALQEDSSESSATSEVDESVKTSSSNVKHKSSSSSKKVSSSSSSKPKSSSAMSSSVQIRSCSSKVRSSSSSVASSSSEAGPQVSGWCVLDAPEVVYVGDTVTWRYLPEENSIDSAKYEWKDVSKGKEVESGLVEGELSGSGAAKITVTFTSKGTKLGPELTFGDVEMDCRNVVVHVQDESISSSSVVSSSSAARRSSSSRSSSSAVPEGHCAVSKSKVFVGDTVEWYVAGPDEEVLSAYHNWSDLGKDGKLVSGELKGNGSSKILVTYSSPGQKSSVVQFGKQMIDCNINDDGDPFLNVAAKAVSSASEPPKESSSSEATPKSSSSKAMSSSSAISELNPVEVALGKCVTAIADSVGKVGSTYYICKPSKWVEASAVECDTYRWAPGKDGDSKLGSVDSKNCYVYEDKVWRIGIASDCSLNLSGCTKLRQGMVGLGSDKIWHICDNKSWRNATDIEKDTASWGAGKFNGEIRVGQVNTAIYYIYETSKKTWRKATTLEKDTYDYKSNKTWSAGVDGEIKKGSLTDTIYVYDASAWRMADSVEKVLGGCVTAIADSVGKVNSIDYVCEPRKWNAMLLVDDRDGQTYRTVKIGNQIWMAENLNYKMANSFCYNDETSNCTKYGRLYLWSAAMDSVGIWSSNGKNCGYNQFCSPIYPVRGACPSGWHLPSKSEWEDLIMAVGD